MHNDSVNEFEKFPGAKSGEISGEQAERAAEWEAAMNGEGVPEFAGDEYGIAKPANEFYGETVAVENELDDSKNGDVADAAKIMNYFPLNKISDILGPDAVLNGLITFDTDKIMESRDPRVDFYEHVISMRPKSEQLKQMNNYEEALKTTTDLGREEIGAVELDAKTREGMKNAIKEVQDFIYLVKGASPELAAVMDGGDFNSVKEKAFKKYGHGDLMSIFRYFSEESGVPGFWGEENVGNDEANDSNDGADRELNEGDNEDKITKISDYRNEDAEKEAVEELEEIWRRGEVRDDAA